MKKSELRPIYLEMRKGLSSEELFEISGSIADRFYLEIDLDIRALHCFISMQHTGEVETKFIFERLWRDLPRVQTYAPRVDEHSGELECVKFTPATILKQNKWKIPEPSGGEATDPQVVDLIVVPLLCFDECGHRVGYGKGFYDRFLQKCRPDCVRAGLSFFQPVQSIADVHEGDIPLDVCVTPRQVYRWPRP